MTKFKVGDMVKSKAGGPKLVVDGVYVPLRLGIPNDDLDTKYWCIWWVGSKRHREQFSEGGLDPWTESS